MATDHSKAVRGKPSFWDSGEGGQDSGKGPVDFGRSVDSGKASGRNTLPLPESGQL